MNLKKTYCLYFDKLPCFCVDYAKGKNKVGSLLFKNFD